VESVTGHLRSLVRLVTQIDVEFAKCLPLPQSLSGFIEAHTGLIAHKFANFSANREWQLNDAGFLLVIRLGVKLKCRSYCDCVEHEAKNSVSGDLA
jgi:hypothetical protein